MRLLFFNFTINYGGGPQYMVHLMKLLSQEHEVYVLDAYGKCVPYVEAVRSLNVRLDVLCPTETDCYVGGKGLRRYGKALRQLPQFMKLRKRLRKALAEFSPDVVWVMNEKSLTFLNFSRPRRSLPILMFEIGWSRAETVSRWLRYLMKRKAAGVVAVSSATQGELEKAGVPRSKLYLGSMTVDFDEILGLSKEPHVVSTESEAFYPKILHLAARPTFAKGLHLAYEAVADLKEKGFRPALWITGAMPTGANNNYVQELGRLAERLAIKENIFFLGWQANFPSILNACDIGILPSYTEGFPRVILEAMLLKKPVIATPVGGVEDSIRHGKTGLIVPVGEATALSEAIQKVLQDSDLKQKMVEDAWEMIHSQFSPQIHLENLEGILREVVVNSRKLNSSEV